MARGWDGLICLGQPGCVFSYGILFGRVLILPIHTGAAGIIPCILWVKQAENMAASLLITYESPR